MWVLCASETVLVLVVRVFFCAFVLLWCASANRGQGYGSWTRDFTTGTMSLLGVERFQKGQVSGDCREEEASGGVDLLEAVRGARVSRLPSPVERGPR